MKFDWLDLLSCVLLYPMHIYRKADLENEKIHWDEEKDKLEHSIKSLEVDLANAQSM